MRRQLVIAMTSCLVLIASTDRSADAGDRLFRRKARPVVETVTTISPRDQVAPSPMLGNFRPTPYVLIRGSTVNDLGASGGSAPSLGLYGPLSAFRSVSAPVNVVTRGYDGIPTVVEGTSFSYPNLPSLSPYVYPTRASNYSAFRQQATPPHWDRGTNWVDLN